MQRVVLMICLCIIKAFQGHNLSHNWFPKDFGRVQLRDVLLADLLLLFAGVEDNGPVRRTYVRPLTIELGWVVNDGEEYL